MLQIRLSKGSGSESGGLNSTSGRSSGSDHVTVSCPEHLVLADLLVAKGLGAVPNVVKVVKTVGRKRRRRLGEKVHICLCCNFPIAIYGRLSPCEHAFCLTCARSEPSCYLIIFNTPIAMARKDKDNKKTPQRSKGKNVIDSIEDTLVNKEQFEKAIKMLEKIAKGLTYAPEKVFQMLGMSSKGSPREGSSSVNRPTAPSSTGTPPNVFKKSVGSRGVKLNVKANGTVFEDTNVQTL